MSAQNQGDLFKTLCSKITTNHSAVDLIYTSIHEFHETCYSVTSHCTGQFTPKMKANAEPRLLSSLV